MIYILILLFGLLLALQIADVISTVLALERTDRVESNPRVKSLMDRFGIIPALVLTKMATAIPLAVGIMGTAYYPVLWVQVVVCAVLVVVSGYHARIVWHNIDLI